MKALHPLTEEQRIFAEKHHDFIYQYLNGRHLNIEDYYDTAVFGYLKAVQDYLEKPELQQYRFSTIARIAMRDALATEWKKQNRPMRRAYLEEYQEDTAELDAFLPTRQERLAEAMDDREPPAGASGLSDAEGTPGGPSAGGRLHLPRNCRDL